MRIAVVHSFYSSAAPSGENQVVIDQVKELEAAGHEVRLIARWTDKDSKARLYKVRSVLAAANVAGPDPSAELREFNPDIVHVHNLFPNFGTAWVKEFAGRLVVTQHNFRPLCAGATLYRDGSDCELCLDHGSQKALRHKCYRDSLVATAPLAFASRDRGSHHPLMRHAARLVVLNERARAIFERVAPGRTVKMPNFVYPQPQDAELGDAWVCVARLSREKGVLAMLDEFPADQRLEIMGAGADAELIAARCASSNGMWSYLGQVPREEVLGHMRAARGLVIPSLNSEGIPTVALEALSAGTPLVLSDAMTSAGDLARDDAGEVYSPREAGGLEAALGRVSSGGTARREAARRLYQREYSPAVWVAKAQELYESVRAGL